MKKQDRPKEYQPHFNFENANGHSAWLEALVQNIEGEVQAELENEAITCDCSLENEFDTETIGAFVEGSLQGDEFKRVRDHVFSCENCADSVIRIARMHEGFEANVNVDDSETFSARKISGFSDRGQIWIDWFERIGLRPDGLTMFPDGTIADDAWEFGRLLEGELSEGTLAVLSDAIVEEIQAKTNSNKILIVAFSDAMHQLGVRSAAAYKESRTELDIHVVGARGFHNPRLLCKSKIIKGMSVVLLLDVIRHGRLLEQLVEIIEQHSPKEVHAVAMVNQDYQGRYSSRLTALASESKTPRREDLPSKKHEFFNLRQFDPVSGRSRETFESDTDNGHSIERIRELLPHIQETNAFKQNYKIGKNSYPFAIDVSELLGDASARNLIASRAKDAICGWQGQNIVFLYPASREKHSGCVAELFGEVSGNKFAGLGEIDDSGFLDASYENRRILERCDGAVIVDAAIRSGATLKSQIEILRKLDVRIEAAVYTLDLRRPRDIRANERDINVDVKSLFQVPLGFAPAVSIKDLLKNRYKDLLNFIKNNTFSEDVVAALLTFNDRLFPKKRSFPFPKVVDREKVEKVLEKGATPQNLIVEGVAKGNRPNFSLTGFLDAEYGLNSSQYRDAKYTINNSASPQVLRELGLTFASNCDYSWLTKSWLTLHEHLLTNPDSNWDFLPVIALDAALRSPHQVGDLLTTVEEYYDAYERRIAVQSKAMLFDDVTRNELVSRRCNALEEILVKTPKMNISKK